MFLVSIMTYMFVFLSKKFHHKALIRNSFREYKHVYTQFTKTHPQYDFTDTTCYPKIREEIVNGSQKQSRIIKEFVANVEAFCIAYPDEPICKNCFVRDYKQYPYRLEQNLEEVVKKLDGYRK
jgi:hypothetical protein